MITQIWVSTLNWCSASSAITPMIRSIKSSNITNFPTTSMRKSLPTRPESKPRKVRRSIWTKITYFWYDQVWETCTNSSLKKTHASSTYVYQTTLQTVWEGSLILTKFLRRLTTANRLEHFLNITSLHQSCQLASMSLRLTIGVILRRLERPSESELFVMAANIN